MYLPYFLASTAGAGAGAGASAGTATAQPPDVTALGFVPIRQGAARSWLAPAPNNDADADVEAGLLYTSCAPTRAPL